MRARCAVVDLLFNGRYSSNGRLVPPIICSPGKIKVGWYSDTTPPPLALKERLHWCSALPQRVVAGCREPRISSANFVYLQRTSYVFSELFMFPASFVCLQRTLYVFRKLRMTSGNFVCLQRTSHVFSELRMSLCIQCAGVLKWMITLSINFRCFPCIFNTFTHDRKD